MRTDRLKLLLKMLKKILNDGTAAFKQIMTLVSQKKIYSGNEDIQ